MKNKCPICKKTDCIPCVAFNNVENYGSNNFVVKCLKCGEYIQVGLSREVNINFIEATDVKDLSFSDFQCEPK